MITKRTTIWLTMAVLIAVASWYGLGGRADLRALFEDRVDITETEPLEKISGARAGAPVAPRDELGRVEYTVQKGDNWVRIAKKYGVDDYNELMQHNGYVDLKPGMLIEIPAEMRNR
ncbi:MAG: LysM peptidoglycan-binding domain-containing protein [Acidobacteriota bacterium]|nr:LysM peptidoglycan-binding domain-containing protein [Acidobacteriota bacterium]